MINNDKVPFHQLTLLDIFDFFTYEYDAFMKYERMEDDAMVALKRAVQIILWASILHEIVQKDKSLFATLNAEEKEYLSGLRWVRNRALHQIPYLLKIEPGAQMPIELPSPFFEFIWRSPHEILPPDDKHSKAQKEHERSYKALYENTPVRFTMKNIYNIFHKITDKYNGRKSHA